jgi:hypothetical protein
MSKFKVGDKVVRTDKIDEIMELTGTVNHTVAWAEGGYIKLVDVDYDWLSSCFKLETWTIYNNDKPLSELSDEQVGKLVKHSGSIETFDGSFWYVVESQWSVNAIYRAKQKSERELFIELALEAANKHNAECDVTFAEAMFDAGFKAPEVTNER